MSREELETHRCQFCKKILSEEKGETDHGCLDCAGHIFLYLGENGEEACGHCLHASIRSLNAQLDVAVTALKGIRYTPLDDKTPSRFIEALQKWRLDACTRANIALNKIDALKTPDAK